MLLLWKKKCLTDQMVSSMNTEDKLSNWSGNIIIVMTIIILMTVIMDLLNIGHPIQIIILTYAALSPVFIGIYKEAFRVWKENYIAYSKWVMESNDWYLIVKHFSNKIGMKNERYAGLTLLIILLVITQTLKWFFL